MRTHRANVSTFMIGLGVGSLVGILLAPKSGEQTRAYLTHKAEEGKEYAQRKARELQNRATDVVSHGKQVVAREVGPISKAIAAGRQTYSAHRPNGPAAG